MSMYYLNPATGKYELQGAPHVDAYSKGETDALIADVAVESSDHPGCFYRMVGGVQEWLNPPMELGVEHKTTERYLGKPVYAKVISVGAVTANSVKNMTFADGVGEYVVRAYAIGTNSNGHRLTTPRNTDGTFHCDGVIYDAAAEKNVMVFIKASVALSDVIAYAYYTKTTD